MNVMIDDNGLEGVLLHNGEIDEVLLSSTKLRRK